MALLPQTPLLVGWETKGLTALLLSFPTTCITQKNAGRLPKLPQNMNSLKRWVHMVAEAAPSSSGCHCREERSEQRDLSGPHSPGSACKTGLHFRELDLHCSTPALPVLLGSEVYFGIEMTCTIWTSLLEARGYLQSLTEGSKGTSGTNIRMTRHGAVACSNESATNTINGFTFLRIPRVRNLGNQNNFLKIGQASQILESAGFMLFFTYKQYVTSLTPIFYC